MNLLCTKETEECPLECTRVHSHETPSFINIFFFPRKKHLIPLLYTGHSCICNIFIFIFKSICLTSGPQLYLCNLFILPLIIFCDLTSKYNSIHYPSCGNVYYLMILSPHMQQTHLLFSYTILCNDFSYPIPLVNAFPQCCKKKTSNSKANSLSCKVIPLVEALYRKRAMYSSATFFSLCSLSLGVSLGISEYLAFFVQINKPFKTEQLAAERPCLVVCSSLGLRE